LDADRLTSLDRAIHYLEVAIERSPEDAAIHFDLGRAYRMKGVRAKAEEAFRQASVLTPGEKTYMYELGIECSVLGRTEDAILALERAVKLSPVYEAARDALGEIYYRTHDYRRAAEHFESALGSATRNPRRFALFVRACYQLGDFARIVDRVDQRKADPSPLDGDSDTVYAAGRAYSIVGRPVDAIFWLQKVSTSPEARYFLACAYARIGQYPEALKCFESLDNTSGEWFQKAVVQRAHVLRIQGDAEQAKSLYQSSAAADRNNFEAIRALGEISLEQGDLTDATSQFSAAVALRPESVEVRYELGIALERSGELNEALSQYQAAVESRGHAKEWLRIGVVQCRLGRFAEAIQAFDSCEREEDRSDALLFYRGLAFAVQSKCDDAIRDWAELEQRHPDSERLGLNLARVRYVQGSQFLAKGKPELAIENWELYLKCYPMDENVCADIAELHFRIALEQIRTGTSGAFEGARLHLAAAIQRDPKNGTYRLFQALFNAHCGTNVPDAVNVVRALASENQEDNPVLLYHLGWCLLQNGQSSEAAQMFERVRNMPNCNEYAQYASWALLNKMISDGNFEGAFEALMVASLPVPNAGQEVQQ
jgi:tetratricopeptide (TPR) repeat protein